MQIEEPFSILPLGAPLLPKRCMRFSCIPCQAPQLNSATLACAAVLLHHLSCYLLMVTHCRNMLYCSCNIVTRRGSVCREHLRNREARLG